MSVDLQIVPLFDTVDLLGSPDTSSAYSLSGHVTLSLSSSHYFFESPCVEKLLLESLELVFEGQSEHISDAAGYSAVRICHVTRELVKGEPVELTNEDVIHPTANSRGVCKWAITFDIPIPGWVPATNFFGEPFDGNPGGTQYSLYATARYRDLNYNSRSLSSLMCGLFHPPQSTVSAPRHPIILNRVFTPSRVRHADHDSMFPFIAYCVESTVLRPTNPAPAERDCIPQEILAGLDVKMNVPEYLPINCSTIPLSVRITVARSIGEARRKRVKVIGFNIDLRQVETYRLTICPSYANRYPLPPTAQQPPNLPLRFPHSFEHLFSLGLLGPATTSGTEKVEFSLLPDDANPTCFKIADNGLSLQGDGWTIFDVKLNLNEHLLRDSESDVCHDKSPSPNLSKWKHIRTTSDSPFLKVRHQLFVELICAYEHEGAPGEGDSGPSIATESLHFILPLHFVVPALPSPNSLSVNGNSSPESLQNDPYSKASLKIPAYSQLFYSNGEPREDGWNSEGEQLPIYSKDYVAAEETSPLISGGES